MRDGDLDERDLLERVLDSDDAQFDVDDARALFGALDFIMTGACINQVDNKQLGIELEQLGLPGEHCEVLCQVVEKNLDQLMERLC